MILTHLPATVFGHGGSETADGLVHDLEHLVLSFDYRLVILGTVILASILVGRIVRHRVSN
jgi:hypothetical protein